MEFALFLAEATGRRLGSIRQLRWEDFQYNRSVVHWRSGAERIVNLGDCVSGPLWPRETMDLLDALGLPTVRGNHDRWVAETPRGKMGSSDAFAFDRLTEAQRRTLGTLPAQLDLGDAIVAVHGTPARHGYLLDDVVEAGWCPRGRIASPSGSARRTRPCCCAVTLTRRASCAGRWAY
jgi:hypothetical protein